MYQWVGSIVGAQGCKFCRWGGKNNKPVDWADDQNSKPVSSCDDALTLEIPSSLGVVTTCKTLEDFCS